MEEKFIDIKEGKYFDLIYIHQDTAYHVVLNEEQLDKLNILINVLGEITINSNSFATVARKKDFNKIDV